MNSPQNNIWHESSIVKREVSQTITDYKEAFNFFFKSNFY